MHFAASMFFTDYSMSPQALAEAMEERGFESVWAPEHSHIPVSRKSHFIMGGELPKKYFDVMDPFVTLTASALATTTLKVGTGICLLNQRDPIQTAKSVASLDQISDGRFLFGIGHGWNQDEMENHGTDFKTRHKLVRERVEAMKQIWTRSEAEYHGDLVNFGPMMTWPKPVQKPHPPVLVGGAFPYSARRAIRYGDGWMPQLTEAMQTPFSEVIPQFRQMARDAGRDPNSIPISVWGRMPVYDELSNYCDLGVERVCTSLESETEEAILPILDKWADLIARFNS
jgi:probable F420-dependent oxidoreductase